MFPVKDVSSRYFVSSSKTYFSMFFSSLSR